ncbi:MAG: porin [Alphaproteobacteria bacterium]|nr:porin [Alphaproteobacteria bacterium]
MAADLVTMPTADQKQYQVYFGIGDDSGPAAAGNWGALRLNDGRPSSLWDGLRGESSSQLSGGGLTYFTPSISGLRMGIGVSSDAIARPATRLPLGPRRQPNSGAPQHWQFGGSLGTAALQIGAQMGDHLAPVCDSGTACNTNDFWDIGVAIRIGPGSLSAAYLASQPRIPRADDIDRIDILSLNAGYQVAPRVNVYGGIDWVEVRRPGDATETPLDTRFMFGTSLRF